jgi:hypothetical protein
MFIEDRQTSSEFEAETANQQASPLLNMNSRLELRTWVGFGRLLVALRIPCRIGQNFLLWRFFSCREKKIPCRAVNNFLPWKIFFVP